MIQTFPFGNRGIGPGHPVLLIAEIGINHEGDAEQCARMIDAAAEAGADAIKLQTIDADANYVQGTASHTLFSQAGLSRDQTARMFEHSTALGLEVFTTAGDPATLTWIDELSPAGHKISSGLLTCDPIVALAASTGRPLLISTGGAETADIDAALACAREAGAKAIALFQCTSLYPAPADTLNLRSIGWLEERYQVPTGFSDHALGIESAVLAVAAGARMIEKHFSLDSTREGFDHPLSLEPDRFAELVHRVRDAERMLGQAERQLTEAERAKAPLMRRVLVARTQIESGETLTEANLTFKRPLPGSAGLPPRDYARLLGRRAARTLAPDDPVAADAVEGGL